jgi:hypothetical protein
MYRRERIWVFVAQRPSSRLHYRFLIAVGPPLVGLHCCTGGRGYVSTRAYLGVRRPSVLLLASTTVSDSSRASSRRPALLYWRARLCIDLSVSGCSSPSVLLPASTTVSDSSRASSRRPALPYSRARLCIDVSVSGCSSPSVLLLASTTVSDSSRASSRRPALLYPEGKAIHRPKRVWMFLA